MFLTDINPETWMTHFLLVEQKVGLKKCYMDEKKVRLSII